MKNKVLIVGSANMDLSLNMFRIPAPGETLIDDGGVAYVPGGKGANAAVAFARLGADAVLSAKIGADVHGQRLYKFYKDVGLNTSVLKVDHDNPTGLAVVMKETGGENRIVVYPGANSYHTIENITEAIAQGADAVYLNFEIPFATAAMAARVAVSRGIPVVIDAAPASKEHKLESLPEIEIFSPNETETYEYTGIMPSGANSSLQASIILSKKVKAKYIVLKLGERGAFVYTGKQYYVMPAMKAGKVVDTTAAGDTFTAAMTLEYLRCGDIKAAVRYGMAAGAIAVTRRGASTSVPTEDEVRRLLATAEK